MRHKSCNCVTRLTWWRVVARFYGDTLEALGQKACTFRPSPYARRTVQGVWRLDSVFSVAAVIMAAVIILRAQP
jgi:hypothetical protein